MFLSKWGASKRCGECSCFKEENALGSGMKSLNFKFLSVVERGELIILFGEEEIRPAVWDCDTYKSSGLDGN